MKPEYVMMALDIFKAVVLPLVTYLVVTKLQKHDKAQKAILTAVAVSKVFVEKFNAQKRDLMDPAKPGQWNEHAAAALKATALDSIRGALGPALPSLLEWFNGSTGVDAFLSSVIEGHVEATRKPNLNAVAATLVEGAK